MNILLVGSGGREHALAWKIRQSPLVKRLVIAPGNAGMARLGECVPVKPTAVDDLVLLAKETRADLVVVGPEASLEVGLADRLALTGIPCFGPSQKAARLETSKAFTKQFCDRWSIPTAGYGVFDTVSAAKGFLDGLKPPYVIKADGLAAGKGVIIAGTREEALDALDTMFSGAFGAAGEEVVLTRNGKPVVTLTPKTSGEPLSKPKGRRRIGLWAHLNIDVPAEEIGRAHV